MKDILKQNKVLRKVISEISEIAGYLWQRGWAERNAGNISVNITDVMQPVILEPDLSPCFELPMAYAGLAGSYFLVTGTGKRMRDLANHAGGNILLIKLNENASGYRIISLADADNNVMPTSELATHMAIHQMIAERGGSDKVVMHTHVTELIALTQSQEFCNQEALNKILWSMHPETIIFVPQGVGFVPYHLPGSVDIANETIKALCNHNVALWEKHGAFAVGRSVSETFDVIDILAKSARIFFMCRTAGFIPEGLTGQQLEDLKKLSANF